MVLVLVVVVVVVVVAAVVAAVPSTLSASAVWVDGETAMVDG